MPAPKGKQTGGMKDRQTPEMPEGMPMAKMPDMPAKGQMMNMDEAMAETMRRNQGGKKKK